MKRQVSTEFTLTGEEKYKSGIKSISQNMSVLRSEMTKVESEYGKDTKSIEGLTKKGDILSKMIDNQEDKVSQLREALQKSVQAYGENAEQTQSWQKQLNYAESDLAKLENKLNDNNKSLDKASGKFKLTGGEAKGLGDVVDTVANKFGINLPSGVSTSLNSMAKIKPAAGLAVTALTALVVAIKKVNDKLQEMTKESAKYADDMITMSQVTGLSTETLQEWNYAAELMDVSVDTARGSLAKLTRSMSDANNGTGKAKDTFRELGVQLTTSSGELRNSEDVFWDVVDALGQISNETERDAASMEIFGRSAQELNPLIIQGRKAFEGYAAEAHEAGAVLTGEGLAALGAVDDAEQRLQQTRESVTRQLSEEYAPYMEETLTIQRDLTLQIGDALKESGLVDSFGSILVSVTSLLEPLTTLGTSTLPVIQKVLDPIAGCIAWISDALNAGAALLTWDVDRWNTALGFNPNKASNMQRWMNGADYKNPDTAAQYGNYYDPTTGMYSGNGMVDPLAGVNQEDVWVGAFNAPGDKNWRGGVTWVGENGPERVFLPKGTEIQNNQQSRQTGGDNIYIKIDASTIKEFNDIINIIESERIRRRMGGGN